MAEFLSTGTKCSVLAALFLILGATQKVHSEESRRIVGVGASITDLQIFPRDNPWNTDISSWPTAKDSEVLINGIGAGESLHPDFGTTYNGAANGIPYLVIDGGLKPVSVNFEYADESDIGPYPIPSNAPIEGGPDSKGDRHVIVLDRSTMKLFELYKAYPTSTGWKASSGAIFDLKSNKLRPSGWTSADAAGLPILSGLVRFDELHELGDIRHAIRFTANKTRRKFISPARHFASDSDDLDLPPMGLRLRLKANYPINSFPASAQVILRALKKYGMILADNGSSLFISGAPDPRWNDDELHVLQKVHGSDFEVVAAPGQ